MNAPANTSPSTQTRTTPRIPFKKRVAQSGVYVLGALVVILFAIALVGDKFVPVSYTHLTLPTKRIV